MDNKQIIVLGVGNALMRDDGIGIHVVHALGQAYDLPRTVRLIDGGLAGMAWLEEMTAAVRLLLVDAAHGDQPPGTIYRLTPEDLAARRGPTLSPHEIGVAEILDMARMMGRLPSTVIFGVQPLVTDEPGCELSVPLQNALPKVVRAVADELQRCGVPIVVRQSAVPVNPFDS